ncbi:MAG: hypothetical protein KJO23_05325 [Bacteroidia bacterium]|nr:hypothetical protein [Bacteroidia bacterium]NNM22093.1 hypothetical protein [Flavobacteriaceae bacterium]
MRKDIDIPVVKDVYVAAVREYNKDFRTHDWNVYIINNGPEPLETVLIVSEGRDDKDVTSRMRHSLRLLPMKSYAKIEFMEESVLKLNNFFNITYFIGNTLYDKQFELPAYSVMEDNAVDLPVMNAVGVLAR